MKPVSYKAREGTGGLHRHPCSKQAVAAGILPDLAGSRMDALQKAMAASGSSIGPSALAIPSANSSRTHSSKSHPPPTVHTISMNSINVPPNTIAPNFPFNFPDIKFEQSMTSPERDEDAPTLRLLETCIKELIPWDVTINALQPFINELWQNDQGLQGSQSPALEPLLDVLYQNGLLKVRGEIGQLSYVPLIVDMWNLDEQKFATISVAFEQRRQVLKTLDISLIDDFADFKAQMDKTRLQFCSSLQSHVYIFDNAYSPYTSFFTEDLYFVCPLHELEATLSEALLDNDGEFQIAKAIRKVQQHCSQKATMFISESISSHKPSASWRQRLTLLKIIVENSEEVRDVLSSDQDVATILSKEVWTFLSPFLDAFQAFITNPSLNVATLWRAKLEDHYKPRDSDSCILTALKERFKKPFEKRPLHPMGLMAVCLDPRFKKLKMLSQTHREATYAKLRQLIISIQEVDNQRNISRLDGEHSADGAPFKRQKTSELVNSFNEYMDDSNESEKDELDKYLELDLGQPADLDPREFWVGEYSSRYPRLALLARQLLITPTVPPSCQYLVDGKTLSIRRQALVGDHLDEILFLNSLFSS